VKASGRAIPRALAVGNWFQGQRDCAVRVEMGSVSAIDDIEVEDVGDENEEQAEQAEKGDQGDKDVDMVDADADVEKKAEPLNAGAGKKTKKKGGNIPLEDSPETRIRTLSAVTVSIWLK